MVRRKGGETMTIFPFQLLWWWSLGFGYGGWPTDKRSQVPTALYPKGIIFYFLRFGPVELRWFVKAARP